MHSCVYVHSSHGQSLSLELWEEHIIEPYDITSTKNQTLEPPPYHIIGPRSWQGTWAVALVPTCVGQGWDIYELHIESKQADDVTKKSLDGTLGA